MTDLVALEKYLKSLGSPLVLKGDDAKLTQPLDDLIGSMPAHKITIDVAKGHISIEGKTLTVTGPCADVWPVQGMPAAVVLKLGSATITITDEGVAGAALDAKLPLTAGVSATVGVAPREDDGTWEARLTEDASGVTPTELIALGIAGPLPFPIPPQLNLFDDSVEVDRGRFSIAFAPNTTDHAYYTFAIETEAADWHLIPGIIDFTGLGLVAVITTKAWSVTIVGHLQIGSVAADLGIQVNPSGIWTASLIPGEDETFPGIIDLAQWVSSGGDLGQETRKGFDNLALSPDQFNLALSRVTLTFELSPAQVVSLEIDSELTIVGLVMALVLTLPELTFAGSLAAAPVKVVDMLKAAQIATDGVPETLEISELSFSAEATEGEYTADVTVDGIWPTPPLKLTKISASVAYVKDEALTGSFNAEMEVAGVAIGLMAGYAGETEGWVFEGKTLPGAKIEIGKLIQQLADSFGIPDVPEPIRSLSLTAIELTYKTGPGEFKFACTAGFNVDKTAVKVQVTIEVTKTTETPEPRDDGRSAVVKGTKGYSATFTGKVTFADLQFDVVFDTESTKTDVLVADYVHTRKDPVELRKLVEDVSASLAEAIPPGIRLDLQEVKFVFIKQTDKQWAFGVRLGAQIKLNELPIVGSKLPADQTLAIEQLQMIYSSEELKAAQTKIINPLLPKGVSKLPEAVGKGISVDADLKLGAKTKHITAGVTPPKKAPLELTAGGALDKPIPPSSTDPVKWFDVDKQFGVFAFQRVGIGYQNNVLEFALDASIGLGPISFAVQELAIGSPLNEFRPQFSVKGMALSFNRPPIQIGGAFLKVPQIVNNKPITSYYGQVIVSLPSFGLNAVGGWAPDADPTFFFLYLAIDAPIGGPPFLFVTGLAGGFGINSRLVLPTIEEVGEYPLLPRKAPKAESTPAKTIAKVIPVLQKTFSPQPDQYWVAAGISISSFKMIEAQAVVSVSFGVDVQIGVVGTASMSMPTGTKTPVAYIELDVVASFTPSTGLLAIDAKLSPASYLFGGFIKLTGGFALYAWFSGDHAGDFVVSVGGYHPALVKPDNYPAVPRLGLAFTLGPLKCVGQAYFALTPHELMAGIRMTATFEAGPIKAWFDAGLDFLIGWAPFHYEAHAWIMLGCSVDLGLFTISVQVSADLQLWGPAFGGTALVDLDVVSFTIGFGAPRSLPGPVGWKTIAENFLPAPEKPPEQQRVLALAAADPPPEETNVIKATVAAGRRPVDAAGVDWILDPDNFVIAIASTIPANSPLWATAAGDAKLPNVVADYHRAPKPPIAAAAGGAIPDGMYLRLDYDTVTFSKTQVWEPELNVAPMDEPDVTAVQRVSLRRGGTYITAITVTPQLGSSNTALWGAPGSADDVNADMLIDHTLLGLALSPVPRTPGAVSDVPLLSLIFGRGKETGFKYQTASVDARYKVKGTISGDHGQTLTIDVSGEHTLHVEDHDWLLSALVDPWVQSQRKATLDELNALGFRTARSDQVSVKTLSEVALTDWPGVDLIGARP
jgi:hypothetical protein